MFAKPSIFFAVLAASVQIASAAGTPACMFAAVNTQDDPSNIKAVCQNASAVEKYMSSNCGDDIDTAMSAFSSVCKQAGVTISTSVPASHSHSSTAKSGSSTVSPGSDPVHPSTITYTSQYFDAACSCTKTTTSVGTAHPGATAVSAATGVSGSGNGTLVGAATAGTAGLGSGSGASATGSSKAGSASAAQSTGGAANVEAGMTVGAAAAAVVVAGFAFML